MKKIYFDHSATTPTDPRVVEAMLPYMTEKFGNASSIHSFGREAKVALEEARESIAAFCGAHVNEIYFTSGGTEADNMAIQGVARQYWGGKKHFITSKIEHHAVLHTCESLEKLGFEVTYLKPDKFGMITADAVAAAIRENTVFISIMHANNEIGTINPIAEIGEVARARGILFHTDAVQSFGKLPLDLKNLPVEMLAASGHKIYGPKGVGLLFIRRGVKLSPITFGGAHERNRRPGTENVPGIIGLAKAVEICKNESEREEEKIRQLRDTFWEKIKSRIPDVILNGHPEKRLAGLLNVTFSGIEGEAILLSLDMKGIAASSGSACTSGSTDPSHVLAAMGVKPELARASIRFSLGRANTMEEIDYAVDALEEIVGRLRSMSPLK
ncbi:MAG: cysteine desulfurase NifS [Calditrichaeota bacterium]|nr:cysteine desulfurase NifS [Calditrichota bacterium]